MEESSIIQEKKSVRKIIREKIKGYTRQELDRLSADVLNNLYTLDEWSRAEIILAFLPMRDEVNTLPLIKKALNEGKKAAVPRIEGKNIFFHYIDPAIFKESLENYNLHPMGMFEPDRTAPLVSQSELASDKTLIITPGLAFDLSCMRLGRGKSFYDRFLSIPERKNTSAGVAFSFQIIENVPHEDHDVRIDYVVTDKNIFTCIRD